MKGARGVERQRIVVRCARSVRSLSSRLRLPRACFTPFLTSALVVGGLGCFLCQAPCGCAVGLVESGPVGGSGSHSMWLETLYAYTAHLGNSLSAPGGCVIVRQHGGEEAPEGPPRHLNLVFWWFLSRGMPLVYFILINLGTCT
jgi:hypothetical protein